MQNKILEGYFIKKKLQKCERKYTCQFIDLINNKRKKKNLNSTTNPAKYINSAFTRA